jgi:hypothetical protein
MVMVTKEGKIVKYFIKDPRSLTSSLKNYMRSLWNSLVTRFAEKFFEITLPKAMDQGVYLYRLFMTRLTRL